MKGSMDERCKLNITYHMQQESAERYLNPADITLPMGYQIDIYARGFDAPSCMTFDEGGNLLVAESGLVSSEARVIRIRNNELELVADDISPPITGINDIRERIYVSHNCHITVVDPNGEKHIIVSGLPGNGDFGGSNIVYGYDNKIYWGQGTITNSGVVGTDNTWVHDCAMLHDYPGSYIILNGQNFDTKNILTSSEEIVRTGAFSQYGEANHLFEIRKPAKKATGSILRANPDGSDLELIAWGLRYPSHIMFDKNFRLFVSNQGCENKGSRPIVNAPDEFVLIKRGVWYGWPDYAGGEPITQSRFRPEGKSQPEFLFTNHPNDPPRPYAMFPSYSGIMGFDFNYNPSFGPYGDVYIAETGKGEELTDGNPSPFASFGHRISKIDMSTGGITTFAINKSGYSASLNGSGGLNHPNDIKFGPDGAMYVLDAGFRLESTKAGYIPHTGVVWRISRNE